MKTSTILVLSALLITTASVVAQPRFTTHSFNNTGAFQFNVTGPAEVEASTNLERWVKFANVSQETALGDVASRHSGGWRFYRTTGGTGASSNIVGYIKVTIPPGKTALLGNCFSTILRLDSPDTRHEVFGTNNPPIQISLYENGKAVPHKLDTGTGAWTPALRPIRSLEGFIVQNFGTAPLAVRLSGAVREGQINLSAPAGASLVVPAVPQPGPLGQVAAIPGKDGMQLQIFNEETQNYQTSTFDSLEHTWLPKPPDYRPGRSFILQTAEPVSWTKRYPGAP